MFYISKCLKHHRLAAPTGHNVVNATQTQPKDIELHFLQTNCTFSWNNYYNLNPLNFEIFRNQSSKTKPCLLKSPDLASLEQDQIHKLILKLKLHLLFYLTYKFAMIQFCLFVRIFFCLLEENHTGCLVFKLFYCAIVLNYFELYYS